MIRKPDYYDTFKCIAGDCEFTCCQEWKIAVDDATNRRWKKTPPPDTVKTPYTNLSRFTGMKDDGRVITMGKDHICPFLNEEKLCKLVCAYGDEILSEACTVFPREVHNFDNVQEYTLMPCCPVVVDMLRERDVFRVEDSDTEGSVPEIFRLRSFLMELLQDKKYSVEDALLMIFYIALDRYEKLTKQSDEKDGSEKNAATSFDAAFESDYDEKFLQRLSATIRGLTFSAEDRLAETNGLFLDLIDNYRNERMYDRFLEAAEEDALRLEELFAGEDSKDPVLAQAESFEKEFVAYANLFRNLLTQEIYADTILPPVTEPAEDLEHMLMHLQWIAMEYSAMRHMCFLYFREHGDLPYKAVRDRVVLVNRMMGYEEDDIYEYLCDCYEEPIWEWGYLALYLGF